MNELETTTSANSEVTDLKSQTAALQRQVTTLLLAAVILAGTMGVYLYQQQKYAIQDRNANTQTAAQMLQVFQQQRPIIDSFTGKLREFGRTHSDFAPILTRYGLQSAPANTSAPPAAVSPKAAPASVPGAKK